MSILSGYGKFKRYVLTDNGYKLCSQWTSSNTVYFDDGNTAQTKVGAINGITDSLTATNSSIALSAAAGKNLQDQVTTLNTGLEWKYAGHVSNTERLSLPPHKEVWIAIDYQSEASSRRALLIPNITAFETDLYGQIGGVTDCVHIYYHQSVVGMYAKTDNGGTENLKLSAWYR